MEVALIGRTPPGLEFRAIRVVSPQPAKRLAERLKHAHVLLQLARFETCSNALIEGINCGLPAIYLDSGSNREVAGEYGVEYRGDFLEALARIGEGYSTLAGRIPANTYRISVVVGQYLDVFRRVLEAGK